MLTSRLPSFRGKNMIPCEMLFVNCHRKRIIQIVCFFESKWLRSSFLQSQMVLGKKVVRRVTTYVLFNNSYCGNHFCRTFVFSEPGSEVSFRTHKVCIWGPHCHCVCVLRLLSPCSYTWMRVQFQKIFGASASAIAHWCTKVKVRNPSSQLSLSA